MDNLIAYGLRENPFPLVPGARVTNWAGLTDIREKLEDVAHSVLTSDTGLSEFVIVHGSYGAGKTHALRYLTTLINETEADEYRSRAIYMPKVRVGPKISFLDLYFQIIQKLGFDFIRDVALQLRQRIDAAADALGEQLDRKQEKELREADTYHFVKLVVSAMPPEDRPMTRLLLDFTREHEAAVFKYLSEGKPVVQGSDYSQQISSDFVATQILGGLFRVLTMKIPGQEPIFQGVHLFIDEVEEVLEAKASEQLDLFQAIRELVNQLPYHFALLLAFSAEAALLEAMMPTAIAERTSRQNIELPALTIDEAKDFIRKQMADFRPAGYVPLQPYYPFSEEAVEYVLEQIVIPVPRKIFRALRTVLERAVRREGLAPGMEIDPQMAEDIILSTGL